MQNHNAVELERGNGLAEGGGGFVDLAVLAVKRANEAHDAARDNTAWADKHDEICELRQGQLRKDIGELRAMMKSTAAWLLAGMAGVIVSLGGVILTLLLRMVH